MSWIPTVYPEDGATGMETLPEIVANFPIDVEEMSLREGMVLVKIEDEESSLTPIPCDFEITKQNTDGNLLEEKLFEKVSGITTQVKMTPRLPLRVNSKYSVILGQDIQERSIYDATPTPSNVGKGEILTKGNYTHTLQSDTYTIEIQESGSESRCFYKWTRVSDGFSGEYVRGSRRSIEIDRGIFVKFSPADYEAGDIFSFNVYQTDKLQDLYSWTFSTGGSETLTPPSESSTSVVNFPVAEGENVVHAVNVVSSSPKDRDVLVDIDTETIEIVLSEEIKGYTPEELKKLITISAESLDGVEITSLDFTCRAEGNKIVIELTTPEVVETTTETI